MCVMGLATVAGLAQRGVQWAARPLPLRPVLLRRASTSRITSHEQVSYRPGDVLHGFVVEACVPVPDLSLTAVRLVDQRTKATHLHVARADANNVFTVGFCTPPSDSTGVAHILEHTTLCGSKAFPCRDPFFKMLTRSLATFMNAYTASDHTMYPFATTNAADYDNLLSVYLDSVFFPKLSRDDFLQEGWRLEHADVSDSGSEITFKGVVYNEMKGAHSSADSLLHTRAQQHLFPGTTYSHVSGGDVPCIPDLTWEQLKGFHDRFYHPSNAHFVTYGDLPLEPHLERIASVLQSFEGRADVPTVTDAHPFAEPRTVRETCPVDPMSEQDRQTKVSVQYVIGHVTDTYDVFVMKLISTLLLDGMNTPLYKALIDSGIGTDYSSTTGYAAYTRQPSLGVGLQGIREPDVDKVLDIIQATFEAVARDGFPEEAIRAVLHQVEFSQRNQSSNFGLGLAMGFMPSYVHGGDPLAPLQLGELTARFEREAIGGTLLQDTVRDKILGNKHRLTVVMGPNPDYNTKAQEAEAAKLKGCIDSLTPSERESIYATGLSLLEQQNAVQDASCLPTLHVSDIDRSIKRVQVHEGEHEGVPLWSTEQPTNGIISLCGYVDASDLSDEDQAMFPMATTLLSSVPCGPHSIEERALQTKLAAGSFGIRNSMFESPDGGRLRTGLVLSSLSLARNWGATLKLWGDSLSAPRFDDLDHQHNMIRMAAADMAGGMSDSGHSYAMAQANSTLSLGGHLNEIQHGLSQMHFLQGLAERDMAEVAAQFAGLAKKYLHTGNMRFMLTADADNMPRAREELEQFLSTLPKASGGANSSTSVGVATTSFAPSASRRFTETSFAVNFVARSLPGLPYSHPDSAPLSLLGPLLTHKFLLKEVREKGGAYGAGASGGQGAFTFYSYRDPNTLRTLETFSRAVDWAVDGRFSDQDISETLLSFFQGLDAPVSPVQRGKGYFLNGITDDMRQARRTALLGVTRAELQRVAQEYLATSELPRPEAVLGTPDAWTEVGASDPSWERR